MPKGPKGAQGGPKGPNGGQKETAVLVRAEPVRALVLLHNIPTGAQGQNRAKTGPKTGPNPGHGETKTPNERHTISSSSADPFLAPPSNLDARAESDDGVAALYHFDHDGHVVELPAHARAVLRDVHERWHA